MARDFLLVQQVADERSNPQPEGTSLLYRAEDLEDLADFVEAKTGRSFTIQADAADILTDGGETDG